MFGKLTPLERSTLASKLSRGAHAFFESADAIGHTALYMEKTGKIIVGDDVWNGLWNHREPIVAAMYELHELLDEADAAPGA